MASTQADRPFIMHGMKRRTLLARTFSTVGVLGALPDRPGIAAAGELPSVPLPSPDRSLPQPLRQALLRRRSGRSYAPRAVPLAAVSELLWAAQGITAVGGRRTAPSAGALYPLELHLVAARVTGLAAGVYRYVVNAHELSLVMAEAVTPALARAALSQRSVADAAAVVVIAAVEERTARKYGTRTSQYVAFEAGAASQNLALQAAALGFATVVIGAFDDAAVARILRLPSGERPVALMPIGVPA